MMTKSGEREKEEKEHYFRAQSTHSFMAKNGNLSKKKIAREFHER